MTPAVSVCVPVYRGEEHLAATIDSVLAQTFTDFELVVLDNCSPDRSGEIAASYRDPRVRVETNATVLPLTENWNAAVRATRAPLVKLLCDDDLLHPRCLERQVEVLRRDPGVAVVAARQHLVDHAGRIVARARFLRGLLGRRGRSAVVRRVVRSGANPIGAMCGITFRRSAFDATPGFDGTRTFVADIDLILGLTRSGALTGQRESLASYRLVPTGAFAAARREDFAVQAAVLRDLRRAPGAGVRRLDVVRGALAAPVARWRRLAGFALAARRG